MTSVAKKQIDKYLQLSLQNCAGNRRHRSIFFSNSVTCIGKVKNRDRIQLEIQLHLVEPKCHQQYSAYVGCRKINMNDHITHASITLHLCRLDAKLLHITNLLLAHTETQNHRKFARSSLALSTDNAPKQCVPARDLN